MRYARYDAALGPVSGGGGLPAARRHLVISLGGDALSNASPVYTHAPASPSGWLFLIGQQSCL